MFHTGDHFFSRHSNSLKWFVLLFAFFIYANTLPHQMALDDYSVILKHSHVQNGIDGIDEILTTNYRHGNSGFNDGLYRPLSLITFALEKEFFHSNTSIAHFMNVLLYAFGCFFLFLSLTGIFKQKSIFIPFLMTLLFVSHPLHTEIVANIKGRDELLAFFGFSLCLFYELKRIETKNNKYLIPVILGFIISLFSKESAVTFALLIPLLLFLHKELSIKNILPTFFLLTPLALAFIFLRIYIINSMDVAMDSGNFSLLNNPIAATDDHGLRWGSTFALQITFLTKLFVPVQLIHDYSFQQIPLVKLFSVQSIIGLLTYVALLLVAIYGIIKNQSLGILAAVYGVSIAVASQILYPIGIQFAERMLFIAVLPFALLLPLLFENWIQKRVIQKPQQNIYAFVLLFIVALFSIKSIQRNKDWENNIRLYAADVQKGENSARINYNYGSELYEQSQLNISVPQKQAYLKASVAYLTKAIQIYPDYVDAYNNLGLAHNNSGNTKQAIAVFNRGIKQKSDYSKLHFNLGIVYFKNKQYTQAIESFKNYLNFYPNSEEAYSLMGQAAGNIGDFKLAIQYLTRSVQLNPNNLLAYNFLGLANGMLGNNSQAEQNFTKGLTIDPNNIEVLMNLALSYRNQGKKEAEKKVLLKILSIQPNHQQAKNQLNSL